MNRTKNDHFCVTQEDFYPLKDYRESRPRDSSNKKMGYPQAHPMVKREACSFNVPWQMPDVVNPDTDKEQI